MRNENDCSPSASNNPSSSSTNSSSSSPSRGPSKPAQPPANVFRREFLDRLVEREEATVAGRLFWYQDRVSIS